MQDDEDECSAGEELPRPAEQEQAVIPADDVRLSFADHIKPLFREMDRKSMSFAFDRESYVRDILYGFGVTAVCPFPVTNWAFDAATCDPYLAFDLDKAAQLLEEAGHPGGQGLEGIDISRRSATRS